MVQHGRDRTIASVGIVGVACRQDTAKTTLSNEWESG